MDVERIAVELIADGGVATLVAQTSSLVGVVGHFAAVMVAIQRHRSLAEPEKRRQIGGYLRADEFPGAARFDGGERCPARLATQWIGAPSR